MSDWQTIYGSRVDGDPVRALPDPFVTESGVATTTAGHIDTINSTFKQIVNDDSDGFRGDTAQALVTKARSWQGKLQPAVGVFESVASILAGHADTLTGMRSDASFAVAQAMAAWKLRNAAVTRIASAQSSVNSADGQVNEATKTLEWIDTQIAMIAPGSPDSQIRLPKLKAEKATWSSELSSRIGNRSQQQASLNAANTDENTANQELAYWLNGNQPRSWQRLREREDELNNSTAGRLRAIPLGVLADPGWLKQHEEDFEAFVRDATKTVENALKTAIKVFVDAVKTLVKVIAIVVAAVVIAAAVVAVIVLAVVAIMALVDVLVVVVGFLLELAAVVVDVAADVAEAIMVLGRWNHELADAVSFFRRNVLGERPPAPTAQTGAAKSVVDRIAAANGDPNEMKSPEDQVYLALAGAANNPHRDALPKDLGDLGWKEMSPKELQKAGISLSMLNDPVSGFRANVFVGPNGQIVVGFANTNPRSVSDDATDVVDAEAGSWDLAGSQQREAESLAKLITAAYPGQVVFTGHSLGGDLAALASVTSDGAPAVTFNAKGTNFDNLTTSSNAWTDTEIQNYASQRIIAYHTSDDPLTAAQNVLDVPKSLGNHIALQAPPFRILSPISGHQISTIAQAMNDDPQTYNPAFPEPEPVNAAH